MAEDKAKDTGKDGKGDQAETAEKELDLDNPDQDEDAGSGKSRKKLILMATAALVLIGGGAGAYLFLGSDADTNELAEEEIEEPPQEQAVYLELEPAFIVSLPDRGRQRFLQASVTVRSRDRAAILKLEQHMPAVRHSLSNILSAQTVDSIQSAGGIEKVRMDATDQINQILAEEFQSEAIEDILFTGFVMQ